VKRLGEMIRYASSDKICRSQFLLSYFGQLDTPRCGRCDFCLNMESLQPGSEEFDILLKTLQVQLTKGPLLLDELIENALDPAWKVIRVIEYLVDDGRVVREKDLRLRWKG
jgi:ATP-dependent DNA helicase RecQ